MWKKMCVCVWGGGAHFIWKVVLRCFWWILFCYQYLCLYTSGYMERYIQDWCISWTLTYMQFLNQRLYGPRNTMEVDCLGWVTWRALLVRCVICIHVRVFNQSGEFYAVAIAFSYLEGRESFKPNYIFVKIPFSFVMRVELHLSCFLLVYNAYTVKGPS